MVISMNVIIRTMSNSFEAVLFTIALYYWLSARDENNRNWFVFHIISLIVCLQDAR